MPRPSRVRRLALAVGRLVVTARIVRAVTTVGSLVLLRLRGEQLMVVISGSMAPTYEAGDVVLVRPDVDPDALAAGDVVTFHAPGEPERLTTHRIATLRPRPEGLFLQTKGDANADPDPDFTPVGSVVGVAGTRLPHLGRWLFFFDSPTGRLLILGTPLLAMTLREIVDLVATSRRRRRRGGPTPDGPRPLGLGLATVGVVVASVALGAGLASLTGATFTSQAALAQNTFATRTTFCPTSTGYTAAVAADAPTRWHRLGEAPGATSSPNAGSSGSAMTYRNGVALGQTGALRCDTSTAAAFDGVDDRVTGTELLGTLGPQVFSIELWFRTTTGGGRLLGFGNSNGATGNSLVSDRHLYLTDAGRLVFGTEPLAGKVTITTPGTYLDGTWHHVVATVDGSGTRLYVDGVAQGSTTTGGAALLNLGWWKIGGDTTAGWPGASTRLFYTGLIDEVAVYDTVLSPARVAAHATAGRQG